MNCFSVPRMGLEPIRPQWSQDFKSCVSTNSTTEAFICIADVGYW